MISLLSSRAYKFNDHTPNSQVTPMKKKEENTGNKEINDFYRQKKKNLKGSWPVNKNGVKLIVVIGYGFQYCKQLHLHWILRAYCMYY